MPIFPDWHVSMRHCSNMCKSSKPAIWTRRCSIIRKSTKLCHMFGIPHKESAFLEWRYPSDFEQSIWLRFRHSNPKVGCVYFQKEVRIDPFLVGQDDVPIINILLVQRPLFLKCRCSFDHGNWMQYTASLVAFHIYLYAIP